MKFFSIPFIVFSCTMVFGYFNSDAQTPEQTASRGILLEQAENDIRHFGEVVGIVGTMGHIDCDVPVSWTLNWEELEKFRLNGADEVRLYLSLKDPLVIDLELIMVGVKNDTDMVHGPLSNLIRPCPKTCFDKSSKLLQAYCEGMGDSNCNVCDDSALKPEKK